MWLATKHGFYSIVRAHRTMGSQAVKQPHPNLMMIRARKRAHLTNLRNIHPDLPNIRATRETDYPYRIIAPREDVMAVVASLALDIGYTNFKNEVATTMPKDKPYLDFLHRVWATGLSLTPALCKHPVTNHRPQGPRPWKPDTEIVK